jgi:hypothetical protein
MAKPQLNKTYSSFTNNPQIDRSTQIRRDNDTIKTPSCTIYDIDNAIMSFLSDIVRPEIVDNNAMVGVPIVYANAEKWAQIQAKGYMYDYNDRLLTPLISVKRNSITERDTLKQLDVNWSPEVDNDFARNTLTFQAQYTKNNRYDRFSVAQGIKPPREIYVSNIPQFVDVSYDIIIWTEYTEQLNSIVEQIIPMGGYAWGTTWKFITSIQDYSFETVSVPGEDRLIRATMPIIVKGTLLSQFELHRSTLQKRYSVKRVSFGTETESFNVDTDNAPPDGFNNNGGSNPEDHNFRPLL